MTRVVVFGTGEIAQLAHFYLSRDSPHQVAAFTVDRDFIKEEAFCGRPVVPFDEVEALFPPDGFGMFVALSYAGMNERRARKYDEARRKGYTLISYVSSRATQFGGDIGDNCFILEDNTIQPFARIGSNVTLWSGNHIGHHSTIGDHCFVSSHVVISGGVTVGPSCFIGVNATVRDHVTIGERCAIGMGALVTRSCEPGGVYVGSPARRRGASSDLSAI